ncbi:MAG TPA: WecB/TagA/CpsF family glycosyltransferase [Nitrospiria bacterium]|nr:WecB/TagA/CpsF family glycosyltransferase [Nitrospiria bacterium]
MKPKRIELLGVPVDCVNMSQALSAVEEMMRDDRPGMVVAVNPEKVIKARKNPALLAQLREARLLIPDGIGVVMAARLLGLGKMERVPGSELMPAICERAARKQYRIFLFGAGPEVNRDVMEALRRRFPGLRIVGGQHGYLKENEMPFLIDRINASGADVLFIALGSPKQELWLEQYLPRLKVKVCQGVGGTFDVLSGRVKRAPMFIRKMHLEWLYRLLSEPRRLLRQTALPRFAARVFWQFVIG